MDAALDELPLVGDDRFIDFGEDPLYPFSRTGLCRIEGDSPEQLRAGVRQFLPKTPGVYGMLDALGRLTYVGKSKCLRNRLLSYFLPNNEEDKAGRIVQSTQAIVWETQPSEFAALVREQHLIRTFRPRFNVQGIPRRQQPIFICLGKQPAEQIYTARQFEPKANFVLGPLFGASRASRAVEILNRHFRLRDCSSKQPCSFLEQLSLFDIELRPGCIRLEIGTCLGPCIAACSRRDYESEVRRAQRFLEGKDETVLLELKQQMEELVRNYHFEQAARVRDDLRAVSWLARRAEDVSKARDCYTFIYSVENIEGSGAIWYLIRNGVIEGAVRAPKTLRERRATARQLQNWVNADKTIGHGYAARPETLALVASWFRNHRLELQNTLVPHGDSFAPTRLASRSSKPRTRPRASTERATKPAVKV